MSDNNNIVEEFAIATAKNMNAYDMFVERKELRDEAFREESIIAKEILEDEYQKMINVGKKQFETIEKTVIDRTVVETITFNKPVVVESVIETMTSRSVIRITPTDEKTIIEKLEVKKTIIEESIVKKTIIEKPIIVEIIAEKIEAETIDGITYTEFTHEYRTAKIKTITDRIEKLKKIPYYDSYDISRTSREIGMLMMAELMIYRSCRCATIACEHNIVCKARK